MQAAFSHQDVCTMTRGRSQEDLKPDLIRMETTTSLRNVTIRSMTEARFNRFPDAASLVHPFVQRTSIRGRSYNPFIADSHIYRAHHLTVAFPCISVGPSPGHYRVYDTMDPSSSTLQPAEVAAALIQQAVVKHNTRYDKTFFKAVLAGVMLSFGGLFDLIITGGSPSLNTSNPGLLKVLGGFVFPVGLVMYEVLNDLALPSSTNAIVIGSSFKDLNS